MALPVYASPLQRVWHYFFIILCTAIFLYLLVPIFVIMPLSFNSEPYFSYPMEGYSLRWYEEFFTSPQWLMGLKNSIVVGIFATLVATCLGTLAALGLNRADFRGKTAVMALLISPIIIPIVITAAGMFYFYASIGLSSTLTGLVLAHAALGVPFVVITVSATLVGFDHNLVRAGASLGANPVRVFFKVTLPIILPGIMSGFMLAFVLSMDDFVITNFVSGQVRTFPIWVYGATKVGLPPSVNVFGTILFVAGLALALLSAVSRPKEA